VKPVKEAIALIQEANFDDDALARLPAALARVAGGRSCTLQLFDDNWQHIDFVYNHFTHQMNLDYVREFLPEDLWLQVAEQQRKNVAVAMDDLVPYERHLASRIYNEFYKGHGDDTAHCAGAVLTPGNGVVSLGIHRSHSGGVFGQQEVRRIQLMLPHLARLHNVRFRLRTAEAKAAMAAEALDRFDFAALVVGPGGKIRLVNELAEAVLRGRDGLTGLLGRLSAVDGAVAMQLAKAIHGATNESPRRSAALHVTRRDTAPWRVVIAPLRSANTALVIVEDPLRQRAVADYAQQIYGLTPAEAALAAALLEGETVESFSERKGVRVTTVRTQLASLFQKTDTNRQSNLVALLAALPGIRQ